MVDDAQWLDLASAQALVFVARRLLAESVALVFVTREPGDELAGLPKLAVEGLPSGDARALLGSALGVPLDERVRERIVAETRGNPLALLELPRGLTPVELAGGFGLPDAPGLSGRIEDSFRRRLAVLPADAQRLLLVAAAMMMMSRPMTPSATPMMPRIKPAWAMPAPCSDGSWRILVLACTPKMIASTEHTTGQTMNPAMPSTSDATASPSVRLGAP